MDLNPQLFNEVVQPTQADYPAMSRVISRCLREVNSRDYPSEVINKLVDLYSPDNLAQVLEGSFCIVVRRTGELIGTRVLTGTEIRTVFVLPHLQRSGIGRMIMQALEKEAMRQGLKEVALHASLTSVLFYKKLGYQPVGQVDREVGGESTFMVKELSG
jgi:GNAT superfamily N-acetyltransferase